MGVSLTAAVYTHGPCQQITVCAGHNSIAGAVFWVPKLMVMHVGQLSDLHNQHAYAAAPSCFGLLGIRSIITVNMTGYCCVGLNSSQPSYSSSDTNLAQCKHVPHTMPGLANAVHGPMDPVTELAFGTVDMVADPLIAC